MSSFVCCGRVWVRGSERVKNFLTVRPQTPAPSTKSRTRWQREERHGLPELHVWINKTTPSFEPEPPQVFDERISQWRALKSFLERWTKNGSDGSFVGSFTTYKTVARSGTFRNKAAQDRGTPGRSFAGNTGAASETGVDRRLPFRGLEPFDFKHAPIFLDGQRRSAAPSKRCAKRKRTRTIRAVFSSFSVRRVRENLLSRAPVCCPF